MKVIILCGGMGTRLREETEYKPKPMVEIGGKPILWHIMKLYAHYGYKEFILALGYKGNLIRDYFLNYYYYNNDVTIHLGGTTDIEVHSTHDEFEWKVTLADTGADSMTGYRVKLCEKYINEDRFMLTYGDAVSNLNIADLIKFHMKKDTIGTVTGVFPPSRFGDLVIKEDRVLQFKQQLKDVECQYPVNGGFFIFKREFFHYIPDDPLVDLEKSPIDKLVADNQLTVYQHFDFWQCMDTYRDNIFLNKLWNENPPWKIWK